MERHNGNETRKADQTYNLRPEAETIQLLNQLAQNNPQSISLIDIVNTFSVTPIEAPAYTGRYPFAKCFDIEGGRTVGYVAILHTYVDLSYHRLNFGHMRQMVERYNREMTGTITIAERKDDIWPVDEQGTYNKLYIVDGLHRAIAAVINDNVNLPVIAFHNTTNVKEAGLFLEMNRHEHSLRPRDDFKARLVANDPAAVTVKNICNKYGLSTDDPREKDGTKTYLSSLMTACDIVAAHDNDGMVLDWSLGILRDLGWLYSDPMATNNAMLFGLAKVYDANLDRGALIKTLCVTSARGFREITKRLWPNDDYRHSHSMCLLKIADGSLTPETIKEIRDEIFNKN